MRIACAGIIHETSTFVSTPTTMTNFQNDRGVCRGEEIVAKFKGANVCTGGFIEGAEIEGFELAPLLRAGAFPGGLVDRDDYQSLRGEILQRLQQADTAESPIDGVLLDLHGSMVVDGVEDADGDLIEAVRSVLGDDRPIMATTDLHANQSLRRVEHADAIIGFDT
ncbi:MAG: M81 family metallopeptidase, partial [Planctomycetales bacterium]